VSVSLCNYNGDESVHHALGRFEDVSSVAEAAALGLYLGAARKAARPPLRGKQSGLFLFGGRGHWIGGAGDAAPQQIAFASFGRGSAPYPVGWIGTEVVHHLCGAGICTGCRAGEQERSQQIQRSVLGTQEGQYLKTSDYSIIAR
jgi:hypothetical protein